MLKDSASCRNVNITRRCLCCRHILIIIQPFVLLQWVTMVRLQPFCPKLPRTASREYLYAVVCARMKNAMEAVEHLLEACRMNPDLVLRIPLDPELSDLVPQFVGLRQELDKIVSGD